VLKDALEQILREGSAFFDVRSFRERGQSIWMHACSAINVLASPRMLEVLVKAGAMITEVDDDGWNCLFSCVLGSWNPCFSDDFEALRYLLTVFDDIFARNSTGRSLFGVLADDDLGRYARYGSYRQDLWYCALYRSGLVERSNITLPPLGRLIFDEQYRPERYRALLYLDTWNSETCVPDYHLLDKNALSLQERQAAPGLSQWNPSDLVMMEERISQAIDRARNDQETPNEWASEEDEEEEVPFF
jgi:hypothetical protein